MGLIGPERSLTISSAAWIQYTNVTDRRTDTGRQQRPRLPIASRGKTERSAICNVRCEFYRQYSGMWLGDSQVCPKDSHGWQQPTPVTLPIPSSCSLVSRRIDAPRRKWRQPNSRVVCSILDTFRAACVRGRRCPPSAPYRPGTMRLISCRGTPPPWLLFAQVNHKYYSWVAESYYFSHSGVDLS